MRTAALLLAALCAATASAQLHLPFSRVRSTASSTTTTTATRRQTTGRDVSRAALRRRGSLAAPVSSNAYSYVVNVTVGTPAQSLSLVVDTMNADTWVPDFEICLEHGTTAGEVCEWGFFNTSRSSTYVNPNDPLSSSASGSSSSSGSSSGFGSDGSFVVNYNDGTSASGDYMTDTLALGGTSLTKFQMGLGTSMSRYIGGLGLGFQNGYSNFPSRLLNQGIINTTAYSMWLNSEDASSGSLLFGAVDGARVDGTLARLASISSSGSSSSYSSTPFAVSLTTAHSNGTGTAAQALSSSQLPAAVIITPSDAVSKLPSSIASQIWQIAGATYDANYAAAMISCSAGKDSTTSFTFKLGDFNEESLYGSYSDGSDPYSSSGSSSGSGSGFGFSSSSATPPGPLITVPLADLIVPASAFASPGFFFPNEPTNSGLCVFGIQNASFAFGSSLGESSSYSTGSFSLGGTLLKRQYTVFDLVNNEVAFAPVKFGVSSSSILAFSTYGAHVPAATRPVCASGDTSCTTATSTGSGFSPTDTSGFGGSSGGGDGTFGGDSPTSYPPGYYQPNGRVLSSGAIGGITIVAVFGFVALLGTIMTCVWYGRRKRAEDAAAEKQAALDGDSPPQTSMAMTPAVGAAAAGGAAAGAGAAAAGRRRSRRSGQPGPVGERMASVPEGNEAGDHVRDVEEPSPPLPPRQVPEPTVEPSQQGDVAHEHAEPERLAPEPPVVHEPEADQGPSHVNEPDRPAPAVP